MSIKIPVTPAGIEPATFRFEAQHLNHGATAVSPFPLTIAAIITHGPLCRLKSRWEDIIITGKDYVAQKVVMASW